MKHFPVIAIYLLFVAAPFSVLASSVVINEVMFNPVGNDTGAEWVELYNAGDQDADVSGWELYPDGTGYVTIPNGFSIAAKKFMLVHLQSSGEDSTTDIYRSAGSSNMGNTSGSAALFNGDSTKKETIIKSFVQWGRAGETWESSASSTGLWDKGTFVDLNSFVEGNSLALQQDGIASGGKNAWRILITPTSKSANTGQSPSASDSPGPSPSVTSSRSPIPSAESPSASASASMTTSHGSSIKTIKAYAGEDISSMVGVMLNFLGRAKGLNDESLDPSARFFWNFGDGETKEGRSVSHSYRMPGSYVAGLHVSSGEYAASDYVRIQINPNLVSISSVILGTDGYVQLKNASDIEVDVSGWNMRDNAGHTFILPPHTILGRRADAAIMNSVTALLGAPSPLPLTVFYPNGVLAFSYSGTSTFAARVEAISVLTPELVQTKEKEKDLSPHLPAAATSNLHSSLPSAPTIASSSNTGEHQYAAASSSSFAFPFGAAIGISILGAAGFLISKRFS